MDNNQLTSAELLKMILGDFDTDSNTDVALDTFLFAKKIEAAAKVAIKLTQDIATEQLVDIGGKGTNSFASYSIARIFDRQFEQDERREAALLEMETQSAFLSAIKDRLSEIEKEMEKAGRVKKTEVGQTIKVSLLDKI